MEKQVSKINYYRKVIHIKRHTEDTDDGKISSDLIKIRNGTILLRFPVLPLVTLASRAAF